jgi:hypothetical protein
MLMPSGPVELLVFEAFIAVMVWSIVRAMEVGLRSLICRSCLLFVAFV